MQSIFICVNDQCKDRIINSLQSMVDHKQHDFVTREDFSKRFKKYVDEDAKCHHNALQNQILQKRDQILKEMQIYLDRLIDNHIVFDQNLHNILKEWDEGDIQQLTLVQDLIKDLWTKGSYLESYDIDETFLQLTLNFEKIRQQIQILGKSVVGQESPVSVIPILKENINQIQREPKKCKQINSKTDHMGALKNLVCMNEICQMQQRETICSICVAEHEGHQLVNEFQYVKHQLSLLLCLGSNQKTQVIEFSELFRSQDLQLLDPIRIRSTRGGYRLAFINSPLDSMNSTQRFGFRQIKGGYMWVGIGNPEEFRKNKYEFSPQSKGQNLYLVESKGEYYSINQEDKSKKNLKFSTGDLIFCYIDPSKKTFYVKKGGTREIIHFKLTYEDILLYPCICLYYEGDEVEIIQSKYIPLLSNDERQDRGSTPVQINQEKQS